MDTGLVEMIIYKSEDEGESFDVVQPHNVPEEIKTPEMIGILNEGLAVQLPGDITYYIGQRVSKRATTEEPLKLEIVNVH